MIKHICGDFPIVISSQKGIGKNKIRAYTLNSD